MNYNNVFHNDFFFSLCVSDFILAVSLKAFGLRSRNTQNIGARTDGGEAKLLLSVSDSDAKTSLTEISDVWMSFFLCVSVCGF